VGAERIGGAPGQHQAIGVFLGGAAELVAGRPGPAGIIDLLEVPEEPAQRRTTRSLERV